MSDPTHHGIAVYSASGTLALSSENMTFSHVDYFFVPAGGFEFRSYPDTVDYSLFAIQIMVGQPRIDARSISASIAILGESITVTAGTVDVYIMVVMK